MVYFTNATTGITPYTGYVWNFGNAINDYNTSPSHYYANGTYTVTLVASSGYSMVAPCSSKVPQVITFTTCVADASFSMSPTGMPQIWNTFPVFPADITGAEWNWDLKPVPEGVYL